MRHRAWLASAAAGVAVLLSTPMTHAAEEEGVDIDHVETKGQKVSLVLATDELPAGVSVTPDSVEVAVDGRAVEAKVKAIAAGDVTRSTILVLDASNSMRQDGRFDAATAAIDAFLDAAPADVAIGLVTFAGSVGETVEPTTDHDAIRAALAAIELRKGTSVYDGVQTGVRLAGTEGSRSLLVLSDGADTSSATTIEVARAEAVEAGVVVDVVSLVDPQKSGELTSLAEETGGAVIPSDLTALRGVFTAQADALARQLLVTFVPPAEASQDASVDVTVTAGGTTYQDSAFVTLAAGDAGPSIVTSGEALVGEPVMLAGAVAVAIGLAGLLATVLTSAADTRSGSERRLDAYFSGGQKRRGRRADEPRADIKGSAVAMTDKVVTADLETRISRRLSGAGSALTASEWLLLHAGIAVGSAFVGFVMKGPALGFLGLLMGTLLPWFYLRWRHGRRLSAFNAQLAETLGLMAGGLQAGLSLPQAVDSVVREGSEPMAGELRRALVEQRLGVDITEALEGVAERMESEDFQWIVLAIRIQREVGGNLAEILHTVADTLREREYLRRQVKALSAEGRLSGYILTGMPPLIGFYMMFANPEYVALLYTTVPGYFMLAMAAMLLGLGSFMMSKLAKVEV